MNRKEYLQALEALDMKQSQAGEFFVKNPVTGRRWALASYDGPPRPVAMFLRLMIALKLAPDKVTNLIGDRDPKRTRADREEDAEPRPARRQAEHPWQAYVWKILSSLRDIGPIPSVATVARDAGCSTGQARTALSSLQSSGFVSQEKPNVDGKLAWSITQKGADELSAREFSTAQKIKNDQHTDNDEK